MATADTRVIDLLDGDLYAGDPGPTYAWLRENAPVYWDAANELWGISRYDDILEIEKAKDVFISSDTKKGGYRPNLPADPSIIGLDDPMHTKRRMLVNRGFTPRTVMRWEDHIQRPGQRAARRRRRQGPGRDRRASWPSPLPAQMIGLLLGYPHEMWPKLKEWSERTIVGGGGPRYATDDVIYRGHGVRGRLPGALRGEATLPGRRHHDGLDERRDRRRAHRARPGDQRLPPPARRRRGDHPHGDRAARSSSCRPPRPVPAAPRRRRHDRRHRGVHPLGHPGAQHVPGRDPRLRVARHDDPQGSTRCVLMYPSAEPRPRALRRPRPVRRHPRADNHHVAFGFGTHFCLGAALARLEIRIFFEEFVRRVPRDPCGARHRSTSWPTSFVNGVNRAEVELVFEQQSLRDSRVRRQDHQRHDRRRHRRAARSPATSPSATA